MSRPFWWFAGASVTALREQLNAAGDGARLEVRLDGQDMTFTVVPEVVTAEGGGPPINESHLCPPQCP